MTARETQIQYRRLRAPRDHGCTLIEPSLPSVGKLLSENATGRESYADYDVHGQSLHALSEEARRLLFSEALRYTRNYREVSGPVAEGDFSRILLAGHQPQLTHVGVWFKNFVMAALAARYDAVAVGLLIDNDALRTASVSVPSGTIPEPCLETVVLDRPGEAIPYEERRIVDVELFSSFAVRAQRVLAQLVPDPLVARMWPWAIQAARSTGNLGRSLAQSRHRLEAAWGLTTLELPLSRICDTRPFRRFMLHLLYQLPRLHAVHNRALSEYRQVHRVRSRSHPVADLTAQDGWLESPFWIWTERDAVRCPLLIRPSGQGIQLRAGRTTGGVSRQTESDRWWKIAEEHDAETALDQLEQLRRDGIKLRPRALITTMYARLVLGDLFIHGVGGAKYDQLTDVLIQRFFQLDPPGFLTVSATFLLPLAHQKISLEDVRRVDVLLRDLWYHPERHLDGRARADKAGNSEWQWASAKHDWIEQQLPRGKRLTRHREIQRLNGQLRKHVEEQRQSLLHERVRLQRQLRHEAILTSREHAFCLFPEQTLRQPLLDLAGKDPHLLEAPRTDRTRNN